jgi:hypothetical protein
MDELAAAPATVKKHVQCQRAAHPPPVRPRHAFAVAPNESSRRDVDSIAVRPGTSEERAVRRGPTPFPNRAERPMAPRTPARPQTPTSPLAIRRCPSGQRSSTGQRPQAGLRK